MKQKYEPELSFPQINSILAHGGYLYPLMVNSFLYDKLVLLIRDTIPPSIIEQAQKQDYNLEELLIKKLFIENITISSLEQLISIIKGVVGTVWACKYFEKQGYTIENEVPITDSNNKEVSKSDIVLTDKNGHKTYIELKTVSALIKEKSQYPIGDQIHLPKENEVLSPEAYASIPRIQIDQLGVIGAAIASGKKHQCK